MPHPILVVYLLAYMLLHSLLASLPCKNWFARIGGEQSMRWYRLAYNAIAVLTLLPLLPLLAVLPDQQLYAVPSPWNWLLYGGQALAALGMLAAVRQTDGAHFLGLRQLGNPQPDAESPLTQKGLYAHVRHPIYTFGLLFLWLTPTMTANLLTVYVFWSLYMYIGTFHEEQRLIREFGDAYRKYRQRVPRLIPRWRSNLPQKSTRLPGHDS